MSNIVNAIPASNTAALNKNLFPNFFWSKWIASASVNLAERNAVSPDVIERTTTDKIANTLPTFPIKPFESSAMTAPCPFAGSKRTFPSAV